MSLSSSGVTLTGSRMAFLPSPRRAPGDWTVRQCGAW